MIFILLIQRRKKGKTTHWLLETEVPEPMGVQEAAKGFLSLRVEGEVAFPHQKFLFTVLIHYI